MDFNTELRSCVKVEVAVVGSRPSLVIVLTVSVDVKQKQQQKIELKLGFISVTPRYFRRGNGGDQESAKRKRWGGEGAGGGREWRILNATLSPPE